MSDIYMTTEERNNLDALLEAYSKLGPEEQGYIKGIMQGMNYNNLNYSLDYFLEGFKNAEYSTK